MNNEETKNNELSEEALASSLEKINHLLQFENGKMTFDSAAVVNNREELLSYYSKNNRRSLKVIPCRRVVFTKTLNRDGEFESVQIINPVKQFLKQQKKNKKSK